MPLGNCECYICSQKYKECCEINIAIKNEEPFMSIKRIETKLVSQAQNEWICSATMETETGYRVTKLGQGDSLQQAEDRAVRHATDAIAFLENACEYNETSLQSQHRTSRSSSGASYQQYQAQTEDKSRFNGGGSKQASEKQLNLIEQLAQKKRCDAEYACRGEFGIGLNQITGAQANQLIKSLK
ncbi:DRBM domain-containing protein [Oleidesulfovibrio alaskensis]